MHCLSRELVMLHEKLKLKISILGSSISIISGPIILLIRIPVSVLYPDCPLIKHLKDTFSDHTKEDIVVLQIGTADLYNKTDVELAATYDKLLTSITDTSPDVKIAVTLIPR